MGDLLPVHVQPLGGDVQIYTAIRGRDGQASLWTEGGLVLHAGLVVPLHPHVRAGVGLAVHDLQVPKDVAELVQLRRVRGQRGLHVGQDRERLVVDLDALDGPATLLGMLGRQDDHRLAHVQHPVGRQHGLVRELQPIRRLARHVVGQQYGVDAGAGHRPRHVDGTDPGVGVRASERHPPQHALGPQVASVRVLALDLRNALDPPGGGSDRPDRRPWQGSNAHEDASAMRRSASLTASRIFW